MNNLKTDVELIRVHLKNIENAVKLYCEQIELSLQRLEQQEKQ